MIRESLFGYTKEGRPAKRYLLSNPSGMEVELSDFGASILAIRVPDREGTMVDVLLGYDTLEEYYDNSCGFGAYIGRRLRRWKGRPWIFERFGAPKAVLKWRSLRICAGCRSTAAIF